MEKILIVGVGSILRKDDALGVRVIDELEKETLPGNIVLYSGDISGLDLLKIFPGHKRVIVIDIANMGLAPGTIKVMDFNEIKRSTFDNNYSTHGMTLLETLTLAEKLDMVGNVTVVGVEPFDVGHGLEMSQNMQMIVPEVIRAVKNIL